MGAWRPRSSSTCTPTPPPGRRRPCAGPSPRPRWATSRRARTPRSTASRTGWPSCSAPRPRCSCATGTMCNNVAVAAHTARGDAVVVERARHLLRSEAGGAGVGSAVVLDQLDGERGHFTPEQLARRPAPGLASTYRPRRLVCLEQTHNFAGGTVWPLDAVPGGVRAGPRRRRRRPRRRRPAAQRRRGLGRALRTWAEPVDSIWIDFTKGLGAPIGAVLAGTADLVARARRYKHLFGAAMRQAGIAAAGCLLRPRPPRRPAGRRPRRGRPAGRGPRRARLPRRPGRDEHRVLRRPAVGHRRASPGLAAEGCGWGPSAAASGPSPTSTSTTPASPGRSAPPRTSSADRLTPLSPRPAVADRQPYGRPAMGGRPALEGTTVLELSSGSPAPTAGDCWRCSAPTSSRSSPPAARTRPASPAATASSTPRSARWPSTSPHRRGGAARRLVADADVLLDDGALGPPPDVRERYDELLAAHRRLVIAVVLDVRARRPPGRLAVDRADRAGRRRLPRRGPHGGPAIMPGPPSGRCAVGTVGALGVLLALTARRRDGTGQLVEVSAQEALIHMLTLPTVVYSFGGVEMPRLGDGYPFGIYPCADGYLGVHILTQGHWTGLCRLMGRDDLVDHPRYRTGVERADPAVAAELDALIADWVRSSRRTPRSTPPRRCAARSRSCLPAGRAGIRAVRGARLLGTTTTPNAARCASRACRSSWRPAPSPRSGRRRPSAAGRGRRA